MSRVIGKSYFEACGLCLVKYVRFPGNYRSNGGSKLLPDGIPNSFLCYESRKKLLLRKSVSLKSH